MGGDGRIELRKIIISRSGSFRQMTVPVYFSGVIGVRRKGVTRSEQEEKRGLEVKPE